MARILPPCGDSCPNRRSACQSECEAYKKYRAALDEEKRKSRQARESGFYWTDSNKKAFQRTEKARNKTTTRRVYH